MSVEHRRQDRQKKADDVPVISFPSQTKDGEKDEVKDVKER